MLRLLYELFKDFGLDTLQLGTICFFAWKLATNHLKHMSDKINEISKKLNVFGSELNETKERIAKIEGKLE